MTKQQFISSIEAKPTFIRWLVEPTMVESVGDEGQKVEKHHGKAFINTPDGRNIFDVWFVVDTTDGSTTWQNVDTLSPEENTEAKKLAMVIQYLKAQNIRFGEVRMNYDGNTAEVDIYTGTNPVTKLRVLVFRQGASLTHVPIS